MSACLTIDIQLEFSLWKPHDCCKKRFIKKILVKALEIIDNYQNTHYQDIPLEVSFLLTKDASIQQLNKNYRNKDKPTNVLAFPLHSPEELREHLPIIPYLALGDIVLSYETIEQEARQQRKPFSDHFTHLIVHGWLHLWGYDHQNDKEAQEMEQLERTILAEFAIPNPYKNMI